jgi:hypothetical protein
MLLNSREVLQLPGNHIAYAFSDPAGANACMAMARLGAAFHHQSSVLFSNKQYGNAFVENLQIVEQVPDREKLNADCLFTGTSHPQSSNYFEVKCIRQAKNNGIETISFIDHWVNFKMRFLDEEDHPIYPEKIWVVDERAKQLAIHEGIPADKLVVSGNPYHEYLKLLWKPSFGEKSYLKQLGILADKFTILFVPDPLSLRNGKELVGFTEAEALQQLLEVIAQLKAPVQLIVKCHPLQPIEIFSDLLKKNTERIHLVTKADTLELINASDVIVGFYSNALLEAEALRKKVIRFFPGEENADLLKHNTSLPAVKKEKELLSTLKHCIYE